jgi:hypothetical protein
VAAWFLTCPGQSPAWSNFQLSAVHLRAEAGLPAPVVHVKNATHEVLLFALNPDANPVRDDVETWQPMRPLNLAEQIQVPSDQAAAALLELTAQAVVDGLLWAEPPLSGQFEPWRSTLASTAAHFRGEHAHVSDGGEG